ncbi:MAG: hypothetical protein Q9218_000690 [Villophora microphyllina]
MATTPPPRTSVQTPSTPLHGTKFDTYRSSSNNRKSTRHPNRQSQRATHTPPAITNSYSSNSQALANIYSPPSSAHTSPYTRATKRRRGNPGTGASESIDASSPVLSADMDPLVAPGPADLPEQGALNLAPNLLPTPAKTPRKQDKRKASELQSAARVLFPSRHEKVEDAMPTTRSRRGRKNVGFSLDSSGEDEETKDPIPIFTDSKDKFPELDPGDHNPFLDNPQSPKPPASRKIAGRRGRKAKGHVQTNPQIQDAFNHEKGMVYVFRGKKIFRRFTPDLDHPNLSSEETEIEGSTSPRLRPLTRAAVKPRLLFPTEKQRNERERRAEELAAEIMDSNVVTNEDKPVTPVKQSFAPATPPTTGHATRSATKKAAVNGGSSPLAAVVASIATESRHRKKTSPFDEWQRTKTGSAVHGRGKKRDAEQMERDGVIANNKKIKG